MSRVCEYPAVLRAIRTLALLPAACAGEPSDAAQQYDDVPPCLREVAVQLGWDPPTVSVAWAPHADYLLVGSGMRLRLVELDAGMSLTTVATLDGYGGRVYGAWSPDGDFAVTGSDDGTIKLLAVQTRPAKLAVLASLFGDSGSVYTARVSPDGRHVLTGTEEGRIQLLSVDLVESDLALLDIDQHNEGKVFTVVWSPDGTRALSASGDHTVRLFDVDTENAKLTLLDTFVGPEEFVPVAWSPDGTRAVAGHWGVDNAVSLLSVVGDTLTELQRVDVHDSGSRALLWRDDLVLTGAHDHRVHLLRYTADDDRLRQIGSLPDEGIGVHALSWGPDGDRFARVSSQGDRVSVVTIDHDDCVGPKH